MEDPDDFDDSEDMATDPKTGRPVVRHVVKDLHTALKMKKVQAQSEERRAKLELAKMKLNMDAGERARAHIAVAGPFYLLVLIGGFIMVLATGAVPEEQVSVASALLTLLVTGLMANLRSIVAGEGAGKEETGETPTTKAKK